MLRPLRLLRWEGEGGGGAQGVLSRGVARSAALCMLCCRQRASVPPKGGQPLHLTAAVPGWSACIRKGKMPRLRTGLDSGVTRGKKVKPQRPACHTSCVLESTWHCWHRCNWFIVLWVQAAPLAISCVCNTFQPACKPWRGRSQEPHMFSPAFPSKIVQPCPRPTCLHQSSWQATSGAGALALVRRRRQAQARLVLVPQG